MGTLYKITHVLNAKQKALLMMRNVKIISESWKANFQYKQ